jgi:hypothetical protein
MSWDEREPDRVREAEDTHPLFKKAFYDGRVHTFILIHLTDLGHNDILRKTFH